MKWISVKKAMPEPRKKVLVSTQTGRVFISEVESDTLYFDPYHLCSDQEEITHWMPLPAPPQNKTGR